MMFTAHELRDALPVELPLDVCMLIKHYAAHALGQALREARDQQHAKLEQRKVEQAMRYVLKQLQRLVSETYPQIMLRFGDFASLRFSPTQICALVRERLADVPHLCTVPYGVNMDMLQVKLI